MRHQECCSQTGSRSTCNSKYLAKTLGDPSPLSSFAKENREKTQRHTCVEKYNWKPYGT
jgi:hypothetical protein